MSRDMLKQIVKVIAFARRKEREQLAHLTARYRGGLR